MSRLTIIFIVLFAFMGIVSIALIFLYSRGKVKRKVLQEQLEDLLDQNTEFKDKLRRMSMVIPLELYQTVLKERQGKVSFVPAYHNFAVMDVNTSQFQRQIQTMQASSVFEFMNQILEKMIPEIYEKRGVISKFQRAGFTAFFGQSCEKALEAAVSISEMIEKEKEVSKQYESFSIGVSYGSVLMGISGSGQRMSLITVSDETSLSQFLQQIGRKYDARILITGTFLRQIENFECKFNARKLGFVWVSATKHLEDIYDVYDGSSTTVRNQKRKTKIIFEKGVNFYANGEWEKARQYFLGVFQTNHHDCAAMEYLKKCEEMIERKDYSEIVPQIETF